jgi:hypothetical protein
MCLNWSLILPINQWVKFLIRYTRCDDGKRCSAHSELYRTLGRGKTFPPYLRDAISLYSFHIGKNYPDMLRQGIQICFIPSLGNILSSMYH